MRVRALVSFSGTAGTIARGAEFDLPDGVDWLTAGLVALVTEPAPGLPEVEHATDPAPATAEKRKRKSTA